MSAYVWYNVAHTHAQLILTQNCNNGWQLAIPDGEDWQTHTCTPTKWKRVTACKNRGSHTEQRNHTVMRRKRSETALMNSGERKKDYYLTSVVLKVQRKRENTSFVWLLVKELTQVQSLTLKVRHKGHKLPAPNSKPFVCLFCCGQTKHDIYIYISLLLVLCTPLLSVILLDWIWEKHRGQCLYLLDNNKQVNSRKDQ